MSVIGWVLVGCGEVRGGMGDQDRVGSAGALGSLGSGCCSSSSGSSLASDPWDPNRCSVQSLSSVSIAEMGDEGWCMGYVWGSGCWVDVAVVGAKLLAVKTSGLKGQMPHLQKAALIGLGTMYLSCTPMYSLTTVSCMTQLQSTVHS